MGYACQTHDAHSNAGEECTKGKARMEDEGAASASQQTPKPALMLAIAGLVASIAGFVIILAASMTTALTYRAFINGLALEMVGTVGLLAAMYMRHRFNAPSTYCLSRYGPREKQAEEDEGGLNCEPGGCEPGGCEPGGCEPDGLKPGGLKSGGCESGGYRLLAVDRPCEPAPVPASASPGEGEGVPPPRTGWVVSDGGMRHSVIRPIIIGENPRPHKRWPGAHLWYAPVEGGALDDSHAVIEPQGQQCLVRNIGTGLVTVRGQMGKRTLVGGMAASVQSFAAVEFGGWGFDLVGPPPLETIGAYGAERGKHVGYAENQPDATVGTQAALQSR